MPSSSASLFPNFQQRLCRTVTLEPRRSGQLTLVDNGEQDLAGVSYPLEQIPACSPWPIDMVIDRGDYSASR